MLKIERTSSTALSESFFLTGKICADHLPEIARLIAEARRAGRALTFDLEGVGPVDREVVSFFVSGPGRGVRLQHCPSYLREWIRRERMHQGGSHGRGKALSALFAALLGTAFSGGASAQEAAPLRLTLREAVQRALSDGTAARIAAQRTEQSRQIERQAESALLPQVDAAVSDVNEILNLKTFGLTLPGVPTLVGPFNVFDAHAGIAIKIIDLAARRRWSAARQGIVVGQAEERRTENEVASAVATLYVTLQRAESQVDEREATVGLFEKLAGVATDQQKAGVATRLDTTRANVQLSRQRQALLLARQERDASRLALLHAIGADFDQTLSLTDPLGESSRASPSLPEALARARSSRPELLEISERLRAAQLATAAEKGERLPSLLGQLQGGYNGNYLGDLSWTRSVAAVVSVPLYTGGRLEARVAEALAREREIRLQQSEIERQVEEEVRRALLAWQTARERVVVARESARLAEEELDFARDRFANGVSSNIEVDNAQTSYTAERDGQIAAQADETRSWFDLQRATGGIRDLLPEAGRESEPGAPSKRSLP